MKNRRRQYLVNKRVQFKLMAFSAIPMLLCSGAMYYLIYYCVMQHIIIPEAIANILLPAMRGVNAILIIVAPVVLIMILRAALVYSNKIVGPLYRLERELERIARGERSIRVKFRKGDELHPLADKVNILLESIDESSSQGR